MDWARSTADGMVTNHPYVSGTPLFANQDTSDYDVPPTIPSRRVHQSEVGSGQLSTIPSQMIDRPNFPHPLIFSTYQAPPVTNPISQPSPVPYYPLNPPLSPEPSSLLPCQISNSYSYTIKQRKECGICMNRRTKRRMHCCNQVICQTCVLEWHAKKKRTCVFCRNPYN